MRTDPDSEAGLRGQKPPGPVCSMGEDGEAQRGQILAQSHTAGHGQGWEGDSGLLPTSPGMFPVSSTFGVPSILLGEWKCLGHLQLTAWGIISKEKRELSQEGSSLAGYLVAPRGQRTGRQMSVRGGGRAL